MAGSTHICLDYLIAVPPGGQDAMGDNYPDLASVQARFRDVMEAINILNDALKMEVAKPGDRAMVGQLQTGKVQRPAFQGGGTQECDFLYLETVDFRNPAAVTLQEGAWFSVLIPADVLRNQDIRDRVFSDGKLDIVRRDITMAELFDLQHGVPGDMELRVYDNGNGRLSLLPQDIVFKGGAGQEPQIYSIQFPMQELAHWLTEQVNDAAMPSAHVVSL